jgi:hypothetical protein
MSNEKYVVTHDDDVLGHDLTRRDAILMIARYDGWGAEFARDDEGLMALRRSDKHIGNNPWHARGNEKPLFGYRSSLENDEAAIEELETGLISIIHCLHRLVDVETHAKHIEEMLTAELEAYEGDTGPGRWAVISKISTDGLQGLTYEWPTDASSKPFTGDEPWTQWGGNTIIERARCVPTAGRREEASGTEGNIDECVLDFQPNLPDLPGARRPAESFFWPLRDNTILEKTGIVKILGEDDDNPILIQLPRHLMRDHSLAAQKVDEAIVEANRVSQQGRDGAYFETLQAELAKAAIRTLHEPSVLHLKYRWDSDCSDVLGDMLDDAQTDVVISNITAVFEHGDDQMLKIDSTSDDEQPSLIDPDNCTLINIERVKITYPRGDRYGVPEAATDSGARRYLRSLGFRVPAELEIEAKDSRDDTPMQLTIWGKAPDSIIETPEPPADRPAER